MTAQIDDSFFYRGEEFAIAGINGNGLFEPQQQGVKPLALTTACYRGFYCGYAVEEARLHLTRLNIGLDSEQVAQGEVKLFGRIPESYLEEVLENQNGQWVPVMEQSWDFRLTGLREPIAFSGGLLIGAGFIREMYVHMGFHPPYKYRFVHELIFKDGELIAEYDRSAAMEELRTRWQEERAAKGSAPSDASLAEWIGSVFSRDYGSPDI